MSSVESLLADIRNADVLFTDDELTLLVEALREYRLRLPAGGRRHVCEALTLRLLKQIFDNFAAAAQEPIHGV